MAKQELHRFSVVRFLSLFACVFFVGCEGVESVIEDLSQRDANIALVLLRSNNIEAHKESHQAKKNTTYHIKVKKNQAENALRLLVENHIPNLDRATLKDVYPPGSSGLIPSKSDELARLIMAMQGESEALLKVVPGIVDARVVFSFDPPMDFKSSNTKKTASVAVVYQSSPEIPDPPLTVHEIKNLIAASFSGLSPEDVTVVQKVLQPHEVVDAQKDITIINQSPKPSFQWLLLLLTAVALLVAGYGVMRLYFMRRV
jgi:type III secretion system YscJ/HrcJ family lipoprotein